MLPWHMCGTATRSPSCDDRVVRSLLHLIDTVNGLEARGIGCRSLTKSINTITPGGKLIFHHSHDCHPGLQDDEPKACFGGLLVDRRFHFSGTVINSYARRV